MVLSPSYETIDITQLNDIYGLLYICMIVAKQGRAIGFLFGGASALKIFGGGLKKHEKGLTFANLGILKTEKAQKCPKIACFGQILAKVPEFSYFFP